jgi:ABC-type enterochelin transport system ATPase subunit
MILRKFNYFEFSDKPNAWSLDGLILENINLLVGKNATGKTNTLTKIAWLGNMLAGTRPQLLNSGNYDVEFFDENGNVYQYKLNLLLQKVQYEELIISGELKFKRDASGIGKIFSAQFKTEMDFHLPSNQLVVVSKRDAIQHPFLEELAKWAEGQRMYAFSSKLGQDTVFIVNDMNNINVDPRDMNSVIGLFVKGEQEFSQDFRKRIIGSMKDIGYELSNIGVTSSPGSLPPIPLPPIPLSTGTNGLMLYVGEKSTQTAIVQHQMSQGMFRALSLIIQVTYNTLKNLSTTILIDDIGEGLDFERSTNIIKILSKIAEEGKGQIIMSTNDRFVMNNIPLKHWQIIQRSGGKCRIFNYHNSKEKFDEFEYMGLNNFDFLATDFINSKWEKA